MRGALRALSLLVSFVVIACASLFARASPPVSADSAQGRLCPGVTPAIAALARPMGTPAIVACEQLLPTAAAHCRAGKALFSSHALSFDGRVSCSTCHLPSLGFRDGLARPQSRGIPLRAPRTPSLVDVARTAGPFFWNGRAVSLQGQIFWPLYAPQELGASERLLSHWGGAHAVTVQIESYLKTLSTGLAPFDRYVAGDCSALAPAEVRGLQIVLQKKNCTQCHKGIELRGDTQKSLDYPNVPSFAFLDGESSYSADAQLAEGKTFSRVEKTKVVTLGSIPQTLRNLNLRGPPWGRYGAESNLKSFLLAHAVQPHEPQWRDSWTQDELADVLAFLFVGLRSEERE